MNMLDARDSITEGEKEWEEFRATFASHLLQAWLLDELPQLAEDYFADLERRFTEGFLNAEALTADDPTYDGAVPIQYYNNRGVTFLDLEYATELFHQLFPHSRPEGDFQYLAWGAVVIGLQAALEVYARSRGAQLARTPLPIAIGNLLAESGEQPLDAETADGLTDLDETRQLLVHHRGAVTERYLRAVKYAKLERDERRPLDRNTVFRMASIAWRVASCLRPCHAPPDEAA